MSPHLAALMALGLPSTPFLAAVPALPPTVNHMYVNRRGGGKVLSREAQDWYDLAIPILRTEANVQAYSVPSGPLRLTIVLYAMSKARDLDNALKAAQDALARALSFDDKRIYYLAVARGVGKPQRTSYTLELF